MTTDNARDESRPAGDQFADKAGEKPRCFLSEFLAFLLSNKKWWLTPIIAVLLLLAVLMVLANTGAAPFIYTLF
jgi:hypothetical protein